MKLSNKQKIEKIKEVFDKEKLAGKSLQSDGDGK